MKTKKIQRPFDIKAAQAGAIVETREGNSVRILCYDMNDSYPIVALTSYGDCEAVRTYPLNGKYNGMPDYSEDLVIVEEVEEPERWADDKDATGEGWYINDMSKIVKSERFLNIEYNCKIFATEKQAKSALAMARISQLMAHDERYGGVVTDEEWEGDDCKYVIFNVGNQLREDFVIKWYFFLAFHSAKQRDLFLAENERLVKDFLMID